MAETQTAKSKQDMKMRGSVTTAKQSTKTPKTGESSTKQTKKTPEPVTRSKQSTATRQSLTDPKQSTATSTSVVVTGSKRQRGVDSSERAELPKKTRTKYQTFDGQVKGLSQDDEPLVLAMYNTHNKANESKMCVWEHVRFRLELWNAESRTTDSLKAHFSQRLSDKKQGPKAEEARRRIAAAGGDEAYLKARLEKLMQDHDPLKMLLSFPEGTSADLGWAKIADVSGIEDLDVQTTGHTLKHLRERHLISKQVYKRAVLDLVNNAGLKSVAKGALTNTDRFDLHSPKVTHLLIMNAAAAGWISVETLQKIRSGCPDLFGSTSVSNDDILNRRGLLKKDDRFAGAGTDDHQLAQGTRGSPITTPPIPEDRLSENTFRDQSDRVHQEASKSQTASQIQNAKENIVRVVQVALDTGLSKEELLDMVKRQLNL